MKDEDDVHAASRQRHELDEMPLGDDGHKDTD
jgi:hypothetical protein